MNYTKFIENQKQFGCCPNFSAEELDRLMKENDPYLGEVDNEDMLLQIEMHTRQDLGKIRINFFLIKLRNNKYTIKDGMKLLSKKMLDYMNKQNIYKMYAVYGEDFVRLGYLDQIPINMKEWGFIININKNMSRMEIEYRGD